MRNLERVVHELDRLLGPGLPGAACRGRAPEFDDEVPGETVRARRVRFAAARSVCTTCPVLSRCGLIATQLHPRLRSGIWAARPF